MSPRKSAVEALTTRARIIDRAIALAAVDGLEGLSIGRLATDLGMSKAGVVGQFGTKEALQLAVVDEAVERFRQRVPGRAVGARPGLDRLGRAFAEWISYMASDSEHGGCFLVSVASEFDGRPGPVRDAVAAALNRWSDYLTAELEQARADGQLPATTDVGQLVFELNGIGLAAQQAILLARDPQAIDRAQLAIRRLLERA